MFSQEDHKQQVANLVECQDQIVYALNHIEHILRSYFPEEHERAMQFYIPQIATALQEHKKWLSRGEYSLQNTIDNLTERCNLDIEKASSSNTISTYLK